MRKQDDILTRFPISRTVPSRWTWTTFPCSWTSPQAQWVCSYWPGLNVGEGIVGEEVREWWISSPGVHRAASGWWWIVLWSPDNHRRVTRAPRPARSTFGRFRKTLEMLRWPPSIVAKQPQSRLLLLWWALLPVDRQMLMVWRVHKKNVIIGAVFQIQFKCEKTFIG